MNELRDTAKEVGVGLVTYDAAWCSGRESCFSSPLGGVLRPVVAHAEEFHHPRHVFRLPNVAAHDARESSPVRLRPTIGDQLVVDLLRERKVCYAVW